MKRKLIVILAAMTTALFVVACGTLGDRPQSKSDQGSEMTADPLGPPSHIESRPLTTQHPSSNTGGSMGIGSNTNLNTPPPPPEEVTQSFAPLGDSPSEPPAPAPMIVEATPPPPPAAPEIAPPPPPPTPEPEPVHEVTKKE